MIFGSAFICVDRRQIVFRCRILALLCAPFALLAQGGTSVTVPFIGCKSDGQLGSLGAPSRKAVSIVARPDDAKKLAYYQAENGIGVLAPRGWSCVGIYGSGGDSLLVSPKPNDVDGPAVRVTYSFGGTSGRFAVGGIVARVFPAYKDFAMQVKKELPPSDSFTFAPYPGDRLVYKSKASLEYRTATHMDGLGTHSGLSPNDSPIDGVAMLVGDDHDLVHLAVRLPLDLRALMPAIMRHFEQDAAHCPCN